jgi:type II secretory pathway pseudopilin PulG
MLIPTSLKPIRLRRGEGGFSLLEAVVAAGIMAGALAALGQLFAISVANNHSARNGSYATVLAEQKMEQLRGLTWGFDTLGLPNTDSTTDTAAAVENPTGTGLSPSPGGTLTSNIAGYVDYVDRFGNMLGGGETIPPRAVYVRRWSVELLPQSPNNTLVLQVLVTQRANRGSADAGGATLRLPDEARLVSVKTRKAP